MLKKLQWLGQLALLCAVYYLGSKLAAVSHLPIPGNVVGILLLYGLLHFGVLKLEHVQHAADFLIKHLVFFFIPVAVDLMNWGGVFYRYGLWLAVAIVLSTMFTYLISGHVTQWLQRRGQPCRT